jgi:hypothetical protein
MRGGNILKNKNYEQESYFNFWSIIIFHVN